MHSRGLPHLWWQDPIKDPARFPWREVSKVQHYWLSVDALKQPMEIREDEGHYGEKSEL